MAVVGVEIHYAVRYSRDFVSAVASMGFMSFVQEHL